MQYYYKVTKIVFHRLSIPTLCNYLFQKIMKEKKKEIFVQFDFFFFLCYRVYKTDSDWQFKGQREGLVYSGVRNLSVLNMRGPPLPNLLCMRRATG